MICKLFLTTCVLLACSTNGSTDPPILMNSLTKGELEQCEREVGITSEEFRKSMMDSTSNQDEKSLCFIKCISTQKGLIESDGTLDLAKIRATFEPLKESNDLEMLISCMEKLGKVSSCQDVIKARECFKKEPLM